MSRLLGEALGTFALVFAGTGAVVIPRGAVGQSFVPEAVLTATLIFVILRVATGSKVHGGLRSLLEAYDVNDYAASVKVYAVKPG